MKALVLGADGDGIGNAIAVDLHSLLDVQLYAPSRDELDVRDDWRLKWYMRTYGPFDYVVYSVGVQSLGFLGRLSHSATRGIVEVNLTGFIMLMDALAATQEQGNVVAIVSDAATVPMRGSIAYCASKAGLAQAIRVAARELAPRWRVNGISPGVVDDTPMTRMLDDEVPALRGWTHEQAREYEESLIPMQRRATKAEVAKLVIDVLYGPQYMTGSIITMTGGK